MLLWLDGADNTRTHPNENYSREVQELFTLGADRGAYTEQDVRELARCFTGNAGEDPHNLILERQGAVAFSYPTLDPGLTQRQTVTLAHGTWTLYCSLLDHKALGMQATLTVN